MEKTDSIPSITMLQVIEHYTIETGRVALAQQGLRLRHQGTVLVALMVLIMEVLATSFQPYNQNITAEASKTEEIYEN